MMTQRASLIGVLVSFVAACSDTSESATEVAEPPGELGAFAVGHSTFTAVDAARDDRALLVDVWYPVDAEDAAGAEPRQYTLSGIPGPVSDVALADPPVSARSEQSLLIFSHGYQGISTQSIDLMEALASHGFIVASPEHTGNAQQSPTDSFDEAARNRVPDVSFLIDTMIARSETVSDAFYERLDRSSVGVVGHSFGGMTAIGTAAGWAGAPADPRVSAIVPVSAVVSAELQGDTRTSPNAGFTRDQLEAITVPVMLVGGTEDVDVLLENNAIAFAQMTNAPRVYKVDIIGANHTHFANVCSIGDFLLDRGFAQEVWPSLGAEDLLEPYDTTCGPDAFPIEEAHRLQNLYTVAFFRLHLRGEGAYEQYLTEQYASTEEAIEISVK